MSQQDENTFVRPEDGRSASPAGGKQSPGNDPNSRYKIMSDGRIFREEPDGNMTFMGYAQDEKSARLNRPVSEKPHTNKVLLWIIVALLLLISCGLGYYFATSSNESATPAVAPVDTTATKVAVTAPQPEIQQVKVVEVEEPAGPTPEELEQRFLRDGHWVGTVAGKGVHGYMDFYGGGPGWIYYNAIGPKGKMELYNAGDVWEEFHDGNHTGTWYINNVNFKKKNFMSGTYVRDRDGKSFKFSLKRQNF